MNSKTDERASELEKEESLRLGVLGLGFVCDCGVYKEEETC